MPLGREVGLGPGHIVLDGDPAPLPQRDTVPLFSANGYLLSSFSLPILSGLRLDVYHSSTHGVALVRIWNAGLKCAACGSLETQDAKVTQKSPSAHHHTTLSGYMFATML